jgi:hypothetical protein
VASDAYSAAKAVTVTLATSDVDYIASVCASQIVAAGVGGDKASTIWAYSAASQTLSAAQQGSSRAAQAYSAATAGAGAATASAVWAYSDASNVRSAAQQANSRAALIQSAASDAVSQATLATSAARQTNSRVALVQSLASDAESAAREASSRALIAQSAAGDAYSQAVLAVAAVAAVPTATQNADALLKRDMTAVTGESARSPLNALRALRNKVAISSADRRLTVYKEDDTTAAWTADVVTDSGLNPLTSVDPS